MVDLPQLPLRARLRFEAKRAGVTASEIVRFRYRATRHPDRCSARLLLLTDFGAYTSDQQYAPIMRNEDYLYTASGINCVVSDMSYALQRPKSYLRSFDTVGLKLSYRTPADAAFNATDRIRDRMSQSARLIYFDGDDDLNVQWPRVLGLADRYVKKHIFANKELYTHVYQGKSNLSDYVAGKFGSNYADSNVMSSGPVSPSDIDKIQHGWNIGLDDRIFELALNSERLQSTARPIDICGRATANKNDWVFPLRQSMLESLAKLSSTFTIAMPTHRVPPEEYFAELRSSTICVSPFGWGEICWRDFEAILSGCLLVKPDMSHVSTEPNIFVPGETYAPVAWDYSDLEQVCAYYLADTTARERITKRAREVVLGALEPAWLAQRVHHALHTKLP